MNQAKQAIEKKKGERENKKRKDLVMQICDVKIRSNIKNIMLEGPKNSS